MTGNHLILRRREIHNPTGHIRLRRPGLGWDDSIEVDLKEIRREAVELTCVTDSGNHFLSSIKCGEFLD